MKEEMLSYAYWLDNLPGIGDKTIDKLLKRYGDPREVYHNLKREKRPEGLTEKQNLLAKDQIGKWDVAGEYEKLERAGIRFLSLGEQEYPKRLQKIPDPPYGLYLRGSIPSEEKLSVAVIGARECSQYGRFVAQELGKALGENGVQVISGMARGIDGISQTAALEAGGCSYGVLGCGVDICYPAGSRELYERLIAQGGVLSSYPPGTLPKASLFPPRNRIVSGLADAVVVVEARHKSGTLITVDMALEQGREVYVVPGRLTDRLSDGCNRLIRQGAGILLSPRDFLLEMAGLFPDKVSENLKNRGTAVQESGEDMQCKKQPSLETQILAALDFYPQSVEQIRTQLSPEVSYQQTVQILMKLCIASAARQAGPGYFMKV